MSEIVISIVPVGGLFGSVRRYDICRYVAETIKHDVIMSAIASQITSIPIVCSSVGSGADQRTNQRSASLAFVRGIHRSPVNFPLQSTATRKMFPFDDIIMTVWKPYNAGYAAEKFTVCVAECNIYCISCTIYKGRYSAHLRLVICTWW